MKNNVHQWLAVRTICTQVALSLFIQFGQRLQEINIPLQQSKARVLASWQILIFSEILRVLLQQPALVAKLMEVAGQRSGLWLRFAK